MKKSKVSEEPIARILQGSREHSVSQNTFYIWKRKYLGMETDDNLSVEGAPSGCQPHLTALP